GADRILPGGLVDLDAELDFFALAGQHTAGELVVRVVDGHTLGGDVVILVGDPQDLATGQVQQTGGHDDLVGAFVGDGDRHFQIQDGLPGICKSHILARAAHDG